MHIPFVFTHQWIGSILLNRKCESNDLRTYCKAQSLNFLYESILFVVISVVKYCKLFFSFGKRYFVSLWKRILFSRKKNPVYLPNESFCNFLIEQAILLPSNYDVKWRRQLIQMSCSHLLSLHDNERIMCTLMAFILFSISIASDLLWRKEDKFRNNHRNSNVNAVLLIKLQ